MKKTFLLFVFSLIAFAVKAQEFSLPVSFKAEIRNRYSMNENKTDSEDLKEPLLVSFDGKRLLCKWESGKVFCDKQINSYKEFKNFKGRTSIGYALEEVNENGLISYIILVRNFDSLDMVDEIKFPFMSSDGMIFSYTIFYGFTDY